MNTHLHTHPTSQHQHRSVGRHPDRPAHSPTGTRARQTEEPSPSAGGFSSILKAYPAVLGITLGLLALLVTGAVMALYGTSDPTAGIVPAALAILALSSLVGGIAAGKLNPATPVAAGLLCGLMTAALLFFLSLVWGEAGLLRFGISAGSLMAHLLGSLLARPRKKSPTHTAVKHSAHR